MIDEKVLVLAVVLLFVAAALRNRTTGSSETFELEARVAALEAKLRGLAA